MTVYISLLRGINVGGSKILSMDALCELYAELGFTHIRTYLQSGNVIFDSPQDDQLQMAIQIERRIEQLYGFPVLLFIRQAADFHQIIANNPFPEQAMVNAGYLHISFLHHAPVEAAWKKLIVPPDIPDKLARGDRVLYLYYPNGFAKAKLSTSRLEKILGVPITDRNWNTVNAVYKIAIDH